MSPKAIPLGCIEEHPTAQTIYLRGVPINLSRIARMQGIDRGYMSHILNGSRDPYQMTVKQAVKISAALGMSVEDLIEAILERQHLQDRERARLKLLQDDRLRMEAHEDLRTLRAGLIPAPRMPLEA